MELFKRYVAASSMGVVALVCVLVGLLGVTVLRPPTHQVSSVVSATDLIMTRGNVLSMREGRRDGHRGRRSRVRP